MLIFHTFFTPPHEDIFSFWPFPGAFLGGKEKEGGEGIGDGQEDTIDVRKGRELEYKTI
jgi:hypothetical protein